MASPFYPAFKLTVYAPRSVDPTETTVMTPVAGAPHSDQFIVTSVQGIAGTKPYLDVPAGRTGTIDPLNKTRSVGTQVFKLLDSRITAGGSNASRWVSAFLGDETGGNRLLGRKAIALQSFDGGATWEATPYWTGRILGANLDTKLWVELAVRDRSKDLDIDVFVGAPHADVTAGVGVSGYAHLSQVAPLGLLQRYGGFPTTTPLRGTVNGVGSGYRPTFRIVVDRTNGELTRTLITQSLYQASQMAHLTRGSEALKDGPKVYIRPAGGGPWVEYDLDSLALVTTTSVTHLDARQTKKAGSAAAPADGTSIDFYVSDPKAKPSDRLPLFIDDIDPIQHLRDLCAGKFGRLDASGNPLDVVPINAASFTAVDTGNYVPWRKRVTKVGRLNKEIEEVCRTYHLAYDINGAGEVTLASLRRAASAPVVTLVDADLDTESTPKWSQSGDDAITAVEGTFYAERYIGPEQLPKPFEELPASSIYLYSDAPDLSPGRVDEGKPISVLVPIVGPRSADVKASTFKIDAEGLRVRVSSTGSGLETLNGAPRTDAIQAHLVDYAGEITGPYGLGPSWVELVVRRASANVALALPGKFIEMDISSLPDPATNQRGGPRLGFVVSRTEDKNLIRLRVLDAGANSVAIAPTIGSPAATVGTTNIGVQALVTLNASTEPARLSYAITDTSVGVVPAATDARWTTGELATATGTLTISNLPHGKRVWVRARTEPTAGKGFKLPSAWAYPAGTGYVNTTAFASPTGAAVATPTASETEASWTNGETWPEIQILLVTGAAPGSWTDDEIIATIPAGSTHFALGSFVTAGTQYTVGIRYTDPSAGTSAIATATFVAGGALSLSRPTRPRGYSNGQTQARLLGSVIPIVNTYGIAVKAGEFPGKIEIQEAIETAPYSGVFGSYQNVGTVDAVGNNKWTTWRGWAPNTRLRRAIRARQVDGARVSPYTPGVVVSPWEYSPFIDDGSDLVLIGLVTKDSPDGLSRTFTSYVADGVRLVAVYKTIQIAGSTDDPWPPTDQTALDAWLAAGTGTIELLEPDANRQITYTVTLPDETKQIFLQFEPRAIDMAEHGPVRRFEIYAVPIVATPQGTVTIYADGQRQWNEDGPPAQAYVRYAESTVGYPDDATAAAGATLTGRQVTRTGGAALTFGQTLYVTIVPYTANGTAMASIRIQGSYQTFQATKTATWGLRQFQQDPTGSPLSFVNNNARVNAGAYPASSFLGLWPTLPPDCQIIDYDVYCSMRVGTTGASVVAGRLNLGTGTTTPSVGADCDGVPNLGWQLPAATFFTTIMTDDDVYIGLTLTAQSAANDVEAAWVRLTYVMPTPDKAL